LLHCICLRCGTFRPDVSAWGLEGHIHKDREFLDAIATDWRSPLSLLKNARRRLQGNSSGIAAEDRTMALSLAQLQAQRDVVQNAIASAVAMVEHGDTRTQMRDVNQLRTALGVIDQAIADAGGTSTLRSFKIRTSKGL
jgi:hypothetical protein